MSSAIHSAYRDELTPFWSNFMTLPDCEREQPKQLFGIPIVREEKLPLECRERVINRARLAETCVNRRPRRGKLFLVAGKSARKKNTINVREIYSCYWKS